MRNVKINILLILLCTLSSCSFRTSYSGKYLNKNSKDVINYLIIYKNNTYLHYYNNGQIILSQKGKWKLSDEPYDRIDLYDFCNYNEEGNSFKKFDTYFFIKNDKWLDIGFDGHTNGSFEKE